MGIVIEATGTCPNEWNDTVLSSALGTFYQTEDNLRICAREAKCQIEYLTATNNEGRLVGGLAVGVHGGAYGFVVNCLPYFGSYGAAFITTGAESGCEEALYEKLIERCLFYDAVCLTVITCPFASHDHSERVKACIAPTFIDARCCQIAFLPRKVSNVRKEYSDALLSMFEGRARTAYRKAGKEGFEIRRIASADEASEFADIHRANIGGKGGTYKTKAFFLETYQLSQNMPDTVEMVIAKHSGKIAGGAILIYCKNTVEYHTTCLLDEYRSAGPLNLIIVERMIDAGMRSYRQWNFGGTWRSQIGVYKFKKSFGAIDHPYYYYTRFFRNLEQFRSMGAHEIQAAYPLCYVLPFSELKDGPS